MQVKSILARLGISIVPIAGTMPALHKNIQPGARLVAEVHLGTQEQEGIVVELAGGRVTHEILVGITAVIAAVFLDFIAGSDLATQVPG